MSKTHDDLNRELLHERFSRRPSWSIDPPPHAPPVSDDPHDVHVWPDDDLTTAGRCRDLDEAVSFPQASGSAVA